MKKIFVLLMMALATCNISAKSNFVQVKDGHFVRDGKPYYYVGTNFWYGAILGSEGQGGNRERLCKELDKMKEMGIDNLRILVGSDGKRGVKTKVEPTLQEAPGVYNDTILAGLDYLLMEMGKRKMLAVLYLNNSWEWSGGYGYYLEQAGLGQAPRPNEDGYPAFMNFVAKYASCEKAHQLFYDYVKFILTRTNRYTKKKYKDDPAIMSWQIGNEPRAFSKEQLPAFEKWLGEASKLIRSLDKNHLISIGSEGKWGCEGELNCWERICADKNVDMLGVDVYEFDNSDANYQQNLAATLDVLMEAAKKVGKIPALTETGCRGIASKKDWFTQTLWPVLQKYQLSYVLFWRNAWDKPQEEAYLPGVGDGDIVKDFKKFKKEKKVLFAKDIVKVKK